MSQHQQLRHRWRKEHPFLVIYHVLVRYNWQWNYSRREPSKGRYELEVAETYEHDRDSGTARPNKGQSQTAPAQRRAEATVLLAGLMPIFLQGAALCHVNMSAGYPWHGAAPSGMNKYKVSSKAMNIWRRLGGWVFLSSAGC